MRHRRAISCVPTFRNGIVVFLILLMGSLAIPAHLAAQTPATTAIFRKAPSAEERAELLRKLQEHAAVLEAQSEIVKIAAKLVGPAVVHIESEIVQNEKSFQRSRVEEAGSGVIVQIGEQYYVLTNRHVVQDAAPGKIKIFLADGRLINPTRIREDADTDIAVLDIDAAEITPATIGDSDKMEIGDFVLAMGSPFGLSHSVTYGIVSAKGRRNLELGDASVRYQDFLQTDAAINPGNSGGPLINLRGEVIGINTAIASNSGGNEGIGFSIPINMYMVVAKQLVERGSVSRAFLGVNLDSQFGPAKSRELGLPRPTGTRVTEVTPNSPAAIARIQVDDIILEFDGIAIDDDSHLVNMVSLTEIGRDVSLLVYRDRKLIKIPVRVGDRAEFEKQVLPPKMPGR